MAVQSLNVAACFRRASYLHKPRARHAVLFAFTVLLAFIAPTRTDECETYRRAAETARDTHAAATVALETAVESHIDATLEATTDPKPRSIVERETEIIAARDARSALQVAFTAMKSALDAAGNDRAALKSARAAAYEAAGATSRVSALEAAYDAAIEAAHSASNTRARDAIVYLLSIDDDHTQEAQERLLHDSVVANMNSFYADVETAYKNFYANFARVETAALSAIDAAIVAIEAAASCH